MTNTVFRNELIGFDWVKNSKAYRFRGFRHRSGSWRRSVNTDCCITLPSSQKLGLRPILCGLSAAWGPYLWTSRGQLCQGVSLPNTNAQVDSRESRVGAVAAIPFSAASGRVSLGVMQWRIQELVVRGWSVELLTSPPLSLPCPPFLPLSGHLKSR